MFCPNIPKGGLQETKTDIASVDAKLKESNRNKSADPDGLHTRVLWKQSRQFQETWNTFLEILSREERRWKIGKKGLINCRFEWDSTGERPGAGYPVHA